MTLLVTFVLAILAASPFATSAQTVPAPRVSPRDGYRFHDENRLDRFVVQRWVSDASPDVSPAGECDCVVVVYAGTRKVLTTGTAGSASAITIGKPTGTDLDGDGATDLVVSTWSGGAHCCYSTSAYSVGREIKPLLMLDTGDCGPGEFADLDGDGVLEFTTCDETWKDTYCSFASTPFPTVVFAYDRSSHRYKIATPRFARRLQRAFESDLAQATRHFAESVGKDAGEDTCAALQPALDLMYAGRMNDGSALLRRLYRGRDADAFVKSVIAKTRSSPLWVAR